MRISDWSSDVCSSDLVEGLRVRSLERRLENFNAPESGAVDGSFYRHPGLVPVFASRGGAARNARHAFDDGRAAAEPPAQEMPRPADHVLLAVVGQRCQNAVLAHAVHLAVRLLLVDHLPQTPVGGLLGEAGPVL